MVGSKEVDAVEMGRGSGKDLRGSEIDQVMICTCASPQDEVIVKHCKHMLMKKKKAEKGS